MEIVAGTYEELLLGYKLVQIDKESRFEFEQSFTDHSHIGSIRCVAISDKGVLASGSTDETIGLLNLANRKEMGSLLHHSGTVNCLSFYGDSHLLSCSDDKAVCVWKCSKWECLRTFKGHKQVVNSVSVHPSGKLALSVGSDRSLRTWNLVTGRSAYITNIKEVGDHVIWSPGGCYYAIIINTKIDIYSVETANIHCTIQSTRRINAVVFINNKIIAYGGEGGELKLHNFLKNKELMSIDTDTNRIKSLVSLPSFVDESIPWIISASSDGYIKVFQVNKRKGKSNWNIHLLAEHNTKFRLTCVAAAQISKFTDIKHEIKEPENEEIVCLASDNLIPPEKIKVEYDSDSSEEDGSPKKKKNSHPTKRSVSDSSIPPEKIVVEYDSDSSENHHPKKKKKSVLAVSDSKKSRRKETKKKKKRKSST